MIDKLRDLLGDDEVPPPNEPPAHEIARMGGRDGCDTETVEKDDSERYTVSIAFSAYGNEYEQGTQIKGVIRAYDGSITSKRNVRKYITEHGEMPIDNPLGNKSPDHLLKAIAIVPGEYIEGATDDEYLAVPYWGDEA